MVTEAFGRRPSDDRARAESTTMEPRLGDIIEDHCSRCTRLTDHSVVAAVGGEVVKVRCRTCNHEHPYRHGQSPKKKATGKLSAFDQVLAGILASQPATPPAAPAPKPRSRRRKPPTE